MTIARDPEKARAWQQRSAAKAQENARARAVAAKPKRKKPSTSSSPASRKPTPRPRAGKPAPPKPAKKRKSLPKRNQPRLTKLRLAQFGTPEQTAMINAMPCCCSRAPRRHPECTGGFSEPSHIVSRGAGGKKEDQVAHSTGCHHAFHAHGRDSYCEAVDWTLDDLRAEADRTWALISGMPEAPGMYAPA